jgi:predicted transcriptional regulator
MMANPFGKNRYKAFVDYSDKVNPHYEADGAADVVQNFMQTASVPMKVTAGLDEMRSLNYKIQRTSEETFAGVGQIYDTVHDVQQSQVMQTDIDDLSKQISQKLTQVSISSELDKIEVIDFIKENINRKLESLLTQQQLSIQERQNLKTALIKMSIDLSASLLNLEGNIKNEIGRSEQHVEQTVIDTNNLVMKNSDKNTKNLKAHIDKKFEDLHQYLDKQFSQVKSQRKQCLYLILKKINKNREMTMAELQKHIKQFHLPRSTLHYYLKRMHEKGIVRAENKHTKTRGRPPKVYRLTQKIKELFTREGGG